jgi:hypothetical protein
VATLSNLVPAKFRLHALSQRIFPLGRCPLCIGPPLKRRFGSSIDLNFRSCGGGPCGRDSIQHRL